MTSPLKDKALTREKLQRLIDQARHLVAPAEAPAQAQSATFDFTRSHHFGPKHLSVFESFAKKLEYQIQKSFETLCQGEFETHAASTSQHYAMAMAERVKTQQKTDFFLPFSIDQQPQSGFLACNSTSAISMVGYMLRDGDFDSQQREMSDLEESILLDIMTAIGEAANTAFHIASGPALQLANRCVVGDWPLQYVGMEDLFSIDITITGPQTPIELTLTLLASAMDPILGIQTKPGPKVSTKELSDRILRTMHRAPVELVARVTQATMSLNDVMNLVPGDILVLNKKTVSPLDLVVNRRPCFKAFPARSSGKYAVVIAPLPKD
jgi:flagellar motor switch protein FliM